MVTDTLDASAGSSSGFALPSARWAIARRLPRRRSSAGVHREGSRHQRFQYPSHVHCRSAAAGQRHLRPFTRTLAPLSGQRAIVSLTTSGFTLLPWNYDAAVAPPLIRSVVSAADLTAPIAPGGLITVLGTQLSAGSQSTTNPPLPTSLGNMCLMVEWKRAIPVLLSVTLADPPPSCRSKLLPARRWCCVPRAASARA